MKLGVVGIGSMGVNHVRIYSELKEVEEVYIFDVDKRKSSDVARMFSAIAVDHLEKLLVCDAVSIAVPTEYHLQIGSFFLSHGKHCLIEKPLAYSYEDAQKLITLAENNNLFLMVGHVEHFNPAFIELKKIIDSGIKIYSIDSRRLSYARPHLDKSIDVIFDLMIHDIELVISLVGNNIKSINSHHIIGDDPWGHVNALLKTESGIIVNLSASRITQTKIRTMVLNTDMGFFSIDFLKQELMLYKSGVIERFDVKDSLFKLDVSVDKILLRNEEPLRIELKHFLSCILNGYDLIVSGTTGGNAVKLAEMIKKVASDESY